MGAIFTTSSNCDANVVTVAESSGPINIGGTHFNRTSAEPQPGVHTNQYDVTKLQEGLHLLYNRTEAWYKSPLGLTRLLEDDYVELQLEVIHRSGKIVTQPIISIEEVFLPSGKHSRHPTKILVKGAAGYGKSTFCKKLIYDWVNDSTGYMSQFLIVMLIRLRDVNNTIEEEVTKLCNKATGLKYEEEQLMKFFQELGRKVLLVLDGYDEASEFGKCSLANINEYGKSDETFLKLATILMTTRKPATFSFISTVSMSENELTTNIHLSFEKILNIVHLTYDAKISLIEKYFIYDVMRAETMKEIVRNAEMKLTRSPLMLHMMCYIHEQGIKDIENEDLWDLSSHQ